MLIKLPLYSYIVAAYPYPAYAKYNIYVVFMLEGYVKIMSDCLSYICTNEPFGHTWGEHFLKSYVEREQENQTVKTKKAALREGSNNILDS